MKQKDEKEQNNVSFKKQTTWEQNNVWRRNQPFFSLFPRKRTEWV